MHPKYEIILRAIGLIVSIVVVGFGFVLVLKKSEDPARLLFKCVLTVLFVIFCLGWMRKMGMYGLLAVGLMSVVLIIMWAPQIGELLSSPLTGLFDGGGEPPEKKPLYSIANAKRKRGQYQEALEEVQRQLARFPNDFEGVMLEASIMAENLQDLPGAEETLDTLCAKSKWPDRQIAAAWTQIADWHLKLGTDVASARATLQKIVDRFPGTEISLHAEQRLGHLVETEKILMDQKDRPRIVLQEGVHNLGLRDSTAFLQPAEIEPGKLAAAHLKHLEAHPHDSEVREKLAVIYAKDYKRLDLATMELAVLINESRHSAKQIAGWLNLLANFQVELGADIGTVRDTLQKIVGRFPDLPLALVTQRRLGRLESEFKGRTETPEMKIGVYEQNIGLKYGGPKKE